MSKTVFLLVKGEEYAALNFEQNFNAQVVYEGMLKERIISKTFESDDCYVDVYIYEFGSVDPEFIKFIRDEIHDYDNSKHYDFIQVVEK